jgi:hypothetical protein
LYEFLIFPVRTTYPPISLSLIHSNIWWSVQVIKLLIMQSSPASFHFYPLSSSIILSTLFSNTFI